MSYDLVNKLKAGHITTDEAVNLFDAPQVTKASDFKLQDLRVRVMDCGFPWLNTLKIFKKEHGELIIVGARPSIGKSAFIFQIASYVARHGHVLGFSLEMSKISLQKRLMAIMTGRSVANLEDGLVAEKEVLKAQAELNKQALYFCDTHTNIDSMITVAHAQHRVRPLDLVVVDYLQLVTGGRGGKRSDEVGEISYKLRALGKDLRCPVLAACQLNRKSEDRGKETGNYKPMLADIRESGNIEQDADAIIMLSRPEQHEKGLRPGEADIGVVKNRNGATGWEIFDFLAASTRFADRTEESL